MSFIDDLSYQPEPLLGAGLAHAAAVMYEDQVSYRLKSTEIPALIMLFFCSFVHLKTLFMHYQLYSLHMLEEDSY